MLSQCSGSSVSSDDDDGDSDNAVSARLAYANGKCCRSERRNQMATGPAMNSTRPAKVLGAGASTRQDFYTSVLKSNRCSQHGSHSQVVSRGIERPTS